MTIYYKIYPTTTLSEFGVFCCMNPAGKLVLREGFQDLACEICGKINDVDAAIRVLSWDIPSKPNVDVAETADHMMIISGRTKDILDQECMSDVLTYAFPTADPFHLLMPREFILPQEGDSAFTIGGKCNKCGRYKEAIWGPQLPEVPEGKKLMAFQLESRLGMMPSWIGSEQVAAALKSHKPRMKGFHFDPLHY
jgi:hypothetical protein